jgi:N-methylhydantoinase A
MGIRRVVIPPLPGLFSAFGMMVADQQYDYQRPVECELAKLGDERLHAGFDALLALGLSEAERHGVDANTTRAVRLADCRYAGQPDVITVEVPDDASCARLAGEFEAAHQRLWNFVSQDKPIVVANLRLQVIATSGWRGGMALLDQQAAVAPIRTRDVYIDGNVRRLPVFARSRLPIGARIDGPAVIEEHSSCAVLKASHTARVDDDLNLVIELAA